MNTQTEPGSRPRHQVLHNGIEIPAAWPPRDMTISPNLPFPSLGTAYGVDDPYDLRETRQPLPVPYLDAPPAIITIDIGRQLFVDDYLIAQTDLDRTFHTAEKLETNPVLHPETPLECPPGRLAGAAPKSGGLWWDPKEEIFKLWYEAGWCEASAFATSPDGLNWSRPDLGIVPGTNRILPGVLPDSTAVFLDHSASDPSQRFKMLIREPGSWGGGLTLVSGDGIHWSMPGIRTGMMNDRSTIFYNPFRKKWIFSIRSLAYGRTRHYREHDDFLAGAKWSDDEPVFWASADDCDIPDPEWGCPTQLYNVDAVAYESLMLGLFQIHRGPSNQVCVERGVPKMTDLSLAYSRDGFHWHRPDRRALIASERAPGKWDRGYVQSVGGVCVIMRDELWFYYSGVRGGNKDTDPEGGMYANRSMGVARMRRDGFASMNAGSQGGVLTTRPVRFNGSHLFVNVDCPRGELRVEVLDSEGLTIRGFSSSDSLPISEDSTKRAVDWRDGEDLSELRGQTVSFRFNLREGSLFSFWVSASRSGCSGGYVAAGGPGFTSERDE